MYAGTYNSPPIELQATLKNVKLMSLPSSLGSSPAKKTKMLANHTTHVCWDIHLAEWLTVEAACDHPELLEVREAAPFGRDPTSELVDVARAISKVEHLERHRKQLWKRSCACDDMHVKPSPLNYVARNRQISPSREHATILSSFRLVRAPHSDGIPPVNLFLVPRSSPKLRNSSDNGSCLGNSPAPK